MCTGGRYVPPPHCLFSFQHNHWSSSSSTTSPSPPPLLLGVHSQLRKLPNIVPAILTVCKCSSGAGGSSRVFLAPYLLVVLRDIGPLFHTPSERARWPATVPVGADGDRWLHCGRSTASLDGWLAGWIDGFLSLSLPPAGRWVRERHWLHW